MKYQRMCDLSDELFRRLTGVKRAVFEKMMAILRTADALKRAKGGRKSKLCLEDQLLLTLEYWREYRTYFHIAQSYGVSESSAYKTVRWVEDVLIKHPDFALPGRKALTKSDMDYEIVLIDATESPVERPKKSKNAAIPERKSATR